MITKMYYLYTFQVEILKANYRKCITLVRTTFSFETLVLSCDAITYYKYTYLINQRCLVLFSSACFCLVRF